MCKQLKDGLMMIMVICVSGVGVELCSTALRGLFAGFPSAFALRVDSGDKPENSEGPLKSNKSNKTSRDDGLLSCTLKRKPKKKQRNRLAH